MTGKPCNCPDVKPGEVVNNKHVVCNGIDPFVSVKKEIIKKEKKQKEL